MDDPNITIEEYIRLEEEKAQKRGKVFNWETAKYGKIWYDEDIHDLISVETEFPAIAFNDEVSFEKTLSCEPTVSSLNDEIDFRISFDDSDDEDYTNEFPAIVYNDAQTSKSNLLTELILSPQHIDGFDLNDKTSLSEYDEEEQNVLYFNDLFPFNIIHPDDLKSEKDNDDNKIDIIQSSEDKRHQYLRYEGLQYSDADIVDFEARLARIYRREVHRVQVFDFGGLPDLMAEGLSANMLMEHRDAQGIGISSAGDFLGTTPSYTSIRDLILRLYHRLIACSIVGRSQAPEKVTVTDLFYLRGMDVGSFIARLAEHFGLLTEERLRGLIVIAPALPVIDMAELVRLQIYMKIDDTWAWVAIGPKRQLDAAAGAPRVTQDAHVVDEGDRAILAPEDVHEICRALAEQREVVGAMAREWHCTVIRFCPSYLHAIL
ncbi:hypothetical protein Tco_0902587 [Tanacetum coccineum]